eukprot:6185543-Pleurochrysis_carterae.AAC.2
MVVLMRHGGSCMTRLDYYILYAHTSQSGELPMNTVLYFWSLNPSAPLAHRSHRASSPRASASPL